MTGYSTRAAAIMSRNHPEQRRVPRIPMNLSGTVVYADDSDGHLALTRDVCSGGAFFYCERTPAPGTKVTLTFVMPVLGRGVPVVAYGTVIRVERSPGGGASGIATQFEHLNIPDALAT